MQAEKPDMFGEYRQVMENIHSVVLEQIICGLGLTRTDARMFILQQSIFEYIEEKHDENYLYYIYDVTFPELPQTKSSDNPGMIVCFNCNLGERIDGNNVNKIVVNSLQQESEYLE